MAAQNTASNFYIPSSHGGGSHGGGASSHSINLPRVGGTNSSPYAAGQLHIKPVASSQLTFLRVQASTVVGNSSIVVKFICAAIVIGYLISFSPQLILMLTVTPGHLIPPNFWIWTCVTHCFIEVHCWIVLVDMIVVILYGKLLEPLWGAIEMLRFFAIVNLLIAGLTTLTYLFIYLLSRNTDYLFNVHIHGLAGYLAGFSVAVKQSMSDHILVNSPFGKLRNKHIPLWVLLLAVLVRVAGGVDAPFPIMFAWGLVVSWVYLRFYQNHGNGNRGDMVDSFSFASFFPDPIQPVIAVLSNTIYSGLVRLHICKKFTRRFETSSPVTVAVSLPGTDLHDAERRRQLALKALNERLSKAPMATWPDLDDTDAGKSSSSSPLLSPTTAEHTMMSTLGVSSSSSEAEKTTNLQSVNSDVKSVVLNIQ